MQEKEFVVSIKILQAQMEKKSRLFVKGLVAKKWTIRLMRNLAVMIVILSNSNPKNSLPFCRPLSILW